MTGGVINVITKSGGNVFSGSVYAFNEGGKLHVERLDRGRPAADHDDGHQPRQPWDVGVQPRRLHRQGPPLVLRRVQPGQFDTTLDRDHPRPRRRRALRRSAARFRPTSTATSLGGEVDLPPRRQPAALGVGQWRSRRRARAPSSPMSGPESTWKAEQETGAVDPSLTYDGSFGATFNLRAIVGRHPKKSEYSGAGKLMPLTHRPDRFAESSAPAASAAPSRIPSSPATVAKLDVTKFLAGHELKAGVDWELQDSSHRPLRGGRRHDQLQASRRRAA